eukprot:CAMPEP_0174252370 /NCGR_PEP_ID=MMETSP0439-20130205/1869_1 /TAXON_ID=0 /ORGANISM="Stereomyxa ramosa, Strain Chinc5" /LENGTH=925 /DNA_ID=CAMNT_0015332893 /DNA_START=41 /DNA_END=2818 /DNA_ORIENTATION=-
MDEQQSKKEERKKRDANWEQVQTKAFTAWLNSYLDRRNLSVSNLTKDFADGTLLNQFLEIATGENVGKWDPQPRRKVQKLINITNALTYVQEVLMIRLVGIGSEDVFEGNKKLILGLIWSLFRGLRMSKLTGEGGGKKTLEEGLLKWVRDQTEGYDGVNVSDFKYGFQDGLAFSALINKFDPELLDYDSLDKSDKEGNLIRAFEIAEKHMSIPKLLDPQDLLDGDPDERSVQLYVSLFFHAFASKAEREKMEAEKQGITSKLDKLKHDLDLQTKEKEQLYLDTENLKSDQEATLLEIDEAKNRLKQLEEEFNDLQSEVAELKEQAASLNKVQSQEDELAEQLELLEELEDKVRRGVATEEELEMLAQLREDLANRKKLLDELTAGLDDGDEQKRKQAEELAEARRRKRNKLEKLRSTITRESHARSCREQLHERLLKENEDLMKKVQQAGSAKFGWSLLKKNLEEHLEDLSCWRSVLADGQSDAKRRIDIKAAVKPIPDDKDFAEQFSSLNAKLEDENNTLLDILDTKDVNERTDQVDKEGYLNKKSQRDGSWNKRWFVVRGGTVYYYTSQEETEEEKGSISLASCSSVAVEEPVQGDDEQAFLFSLELDGRKMVLAAETKKERDNWLAVVSGGIAYIQYKKECEESEVKPDLRLLNFFSSSFVTGLHLDDRTLSTESVGALAQNLRFHKELVVLSLVNAELGEADIKLLAPSLKHLKRLEVLKLGGNNVGSSATHLAEGLAECSSLKAVYLYRNEIDDTGAVALADSLAKNKQIKIFTLNANHIGGAGAAALVEAIGSEHELESLDLGRNAVGDDGAAAIADLLSKTKNLQRVLLDENNIGDKGAEAICEALKSNKSVEKLDLSNNKITNDGAAALKQLLAENDVLERVDLSGNKINGEDAMAFLSSDTFFFPNLSFSRKIVAH